MPQDELPDDLVEFLKSDRRLEYDAAVCEIGVFTFRSLEEVEEIDLAVRAEGQDSTCTIRALDLLKSCAEYDPRGILVYIPALRKYGSYDSEGESLITYRGMAWSDFLAEPARYINAAWYLDAGIAEATFPDQATDRIVEVCSVADASEANGLCEILEEKGIRAQIVGEGLGGAAGGLPFGQTIAPRIWVREGDAGRAREIIDDCMRRASQDWDQPAELAQVVEGDVQNAAVLEAELEPELEPEEELVDEADGDLEEETPVASGVRFGWLNPVFVVAGVGCILGGAAWAASNWTALREYPATTEGRLVEHQKEVDTPRPSPGEFNVRVPRTRRATSDHYYLEYEFVVDGKTYRAVVREASFKNPRMLIHYDPDHPEKNFAGALTPPWIILASALAIGVLLAYCGYQLGSSKPQGAAGT